MISTAAASHGIQQPFRHRPQPSSLASTLALPPDLRKIIKNLAFEPLNPVTHTRRYGHSCLPRSNRLPRHPAAFRHQPQTSPLQHTATSYILDPIQLGLSLLAQYHFHVRRADENLQVLKTRGESAAPQASRVAVATGVRMRRPRCLRRHPSRHTTDIPSSAQAIFATSFGNISYTQSHTPRPELIECF